MYLISRGGSSYPGKNVEDILGWHDAMVYMAALRQCLKKQRAVTLTYHLHGYQNICALVPLSVDKVYSHRLRIHGDYDEALRILDRLAFGGGRK